MCVHVCVATERLQATTVLHTQLVEEFNRITPSNTSLAPPLELLGMLDDDSGDDGEVEHAPNDHGPGACHGSLAQWRLPVDNRLRMLSQLLDEFVLSATTSMADGDDDEGAWWACYGAVVCACGVCAWQHIWLHVPYPRLVGARARHGATINRALHTRSISRSAQRVHARWQCGLAVRLAFSPFCCDSCHLHDLTFTVLCRLPWASQEWSGDAAGAW